ncbi:MAG: Sua5 family C-terminal domain-containing protein, partial [Flavobacteriales bacterium]
VSIVRLGGLCVEDIESVAGKVNLQLNASANPMAPGQLSSHYAPRKPMLVGNIDEIMKQHLQKKMAVLSFSESYEAHTNQRLSPMADVNEAAKNLFGMMRQLDSSDAEIIIAEWLPEVGLGRAVNDRLRRAAHQ